MDNNCIFCKIIQHQAPARIVFQDELLTAFEDIRHIAPVHLLIVPNRHITSINEVEIEDADVLGRMVILAKQLAVEQKIDRSGYRLVFNTGRDAGQSVFHVHLHLIGGRKLHFDF